MSDSNQSTDKLSILCGTIKDQILSDDTLKSRVKKIEIEWDVLENFINVPSLKIEFKD